MGKCRRFEYGTVGLAGRGLGHGDNSGYA